MQPVVLSVVEGKNFLLGTFDTTNFQDWWKSEPFPGAIDEIQQPVHVYGQYHVCICKMSNGTYSIYRTKNMGKSWVQVYNTANIIYTLTLIDFGWVIGSTSAGWIESWQDSGYTWSEISSFAPGCKTVINIDDDVLFAHDGNYIWRSYDLAETWSKVLDCHNISWVGFHGGSERTTFTGYSSPALCGYGSRVVASCGPYLLVSDNLGSTWTMPWGWAGDPTFAAFGIVWTLPRNNIRILQLSIVDYTGLQPDDFTVVARVLIQNTGKVRYIVNNDGGYLNTWNTLFDLNYHGEEIGKINTYSVLKVGTSTTDFLATISDFNSDGTPIFKTSINGFNWINVNTSTVTVYEGDPLDEIYSPVGQQVFDEEYIAKYVWSGVPCHNSGKWIIDLNKTVRGLSWDQDLLISFRKTNPLAMLYSTLVTKYKTYDNDVLNKKTILKSLLDDVLLKKTVTKTHLVSQMLQKSFTESMDSYVAIAERVPVSITPDILNKKTLTKLSYYDVCLFDTPEKTYSADIRLIDDHLEEITVSIERYTPQLLDIEYLDLPYKPYDSRAQRVVP